MTPEKRAGYPRYDLSSVAKKWVPRLEPADEQILPRAGKLQSAGLFGVNIDQFVDLCCFVSDRSHALAILSERKNFALTPGLPALHVAASAQDDALSRHGASFYAIIDQFACSAILCPLGDVIVLGHGAFDDKFRSVALISDSAFQIGKQCV